MRLEGKVAIVTGAGQGIGEAIAYTLAKEGASIVVADINIESATKVADEIISQGGKAEPIRADVSNVKEVNKLIEQTVQKYRKIDILVNNAGIAKLTLALELSEDEWDKTIDVNLKGQLLCSQAAVKYMINQKYGKIVNIASGGGHAAIPGLTAYGASKAGIIQLTRTLAVEWGKYNININAVSPGLTMTPLAESTMKDNPDFLKGIERIPLQRLAKPEDIANVVLFLASSESDYITGQTIIVDGGALAVHPRIVSLDI